jgi:hypothetical protein
MLPSGQFAVLGGHGLRKPFRGLPWAREDAEAFDPVSRAWEPLPSMPHDLVGGAAVAVAGGLLAVGGRNPARYGRDPGAIRADAMLFEEESGRWFTLPGQMPAGRQGHGLTTIPAP